MFAYAPVLLHVMFLAITSLKLWQIVRSCVWIWRRGHEFQQEYDKLAALGFVSIVERRKLLDKTRGGIFPFGIKSYRLTRWLKKKRAASARLLLVPIQLFALLFSFYALPVVASVYFVMTAHVVGASPSGEVDQWLALASGSLLLLCCLSIAAEAILSYLQISSWGVGYHGFSRDDRYNPTSGPPEFAVAFGAVLMTIVSATGLTYLAAVRFDAFGKIASPGAIELLLGSSAYYSFTTLGQVGDADPKNGVGRLVVALIDLNSAAFVFIVVALLAGSVSGRVIQAGVQSVQAADTRSKIPASLALPPRRATRHASYLFVVGVLTGAVIGWACRRRR